MWIQWTGFTTVDNMFRLNCIYFHEPMLIRELFKEAKKGLARKFTFRYIKNDMISLVDLPTYDQRHDR